MSQFARACVNNVSTTLGVSEEIAGSALISTAIFLIGLHFVDGLVSSYDSDSKSKGRSRALSFNSSCLLQTFPTQSGVPQPIVNALLLFEEACPTEDELRDLIGAKIFVYDRYRKGVKDNVFVDLPLEEQGKIWINSWSVDSDAEVLAKVEEMCGTDIDPACYRGERPMWCIERIENKSSRGVYAILFRLHHVLGDGVALINSMSQLFTYADGTPLDLKIAEQMSGGKSKTKGKAPSLLSKLWDVLYSFFAVLYIAISPYDSDTAFSPKGKPTLAMTPRKIVLIPAMRLGFIKSVKDAAGVSVNDVFMSITAGALRRYCLKHGDAVDATTRCRALVPVAFPRPIKELLNYETAMRNLWAFASIALPVTETTPINRLQACFRTTGVMKQSALVGVQLWVQTNLLPLLPVFLQQKTAHDVFSRHTIVFSNLPGPSAACYLCSRKLVAVHAIFPNIIPQAIIISYAGEIMYNISLDPAVVPDAEDFKRMLLDELRELATELGVSAGDGDADMLSPVSAGGEFGIIK